MDIHTFSSQKAYRILKGHADIHGYGAAGVRQNSRFFWGIAKRQVEYKKHPAKRNMEIQS